MAKIIRAADIRSVRAFKTGDGKVDIKVEVDEIKAVELGQTTRNAGLTRAGTSVEVGPKAALEGDKQLLSALKTVRMRNLGRDKMSTPAQALVKSTIDELTRGLDVSDDRFGVLRFGDEKALSQGPSTVRISNPISHGASKDPLDEDYARKRVILRKALGLPKSKKVSYDKMVRMARRIHEQDMTERIRGTADAMAERKPISVQLDSDDKRSLNTLPGGNSYLDRMRLAREKREKVTKETYDLAVEDLLEDIMIS